MKLQENGEPPVLLRADNFTPPSRTPWGGARIRAMKAPWVGAGLPVGEAWELSVEPSYPSRCDPGGGDPGGEPLAALIERAPSSWLGAEEPRGGTALLVKLLDAADALSVQIHPSDDYAGLEPGEAGKPESWYVVAREPGSGLYLGLAPGVDVEAARRALARDEDFARLLGFVPVEPGDFFLIEAGTPHCIGPGVTLVEPQHVSPGRRGVTYRYWDWGRRYDAQGRLDASGAPRALHVEHALAVTEWGRAQTGAILARARLRAGSVAPEGPPRLELFAGPDAALPSLHLRVARLSGTGTALLPAWGVLRGLTVLEGRVELGALSVEAGRTAAIPASWAEPIVLHGSHAVLSAAA